jgi:D-erythro-7,8-dihydroneopterin triphosphate epimerase
VPGINTGLLDASPDTCAITSASPQSSVVHTLKHGGTPASNAVINIKNLRLRTYIGFNPEEKIKQQDVVINLEIKHTVKRGVFDDRVDDALNYKSVAKAIINHVEEGSFLLLEKLTADIVAICSNHPDVISAKVTVDKPHALRFADSVALTLEYQAETSDNNREKAK